MLPVRTAFRTIQDRVNQLSLTQFVCGAAGLSLAVSALALGAIEVKRSNIAATTKAETTPSQTKSPTSLLLCESGGRNNFAQMPRLKSDDIGICVTRGSVALVNAETVDTLLSAYAGLAKRAEASALPLNGFLQSTNPVLSFTNGEEVRTGKAVHHDYSFTLQNKAGQVVSGRMRVTKSSSAISPAHSDNILDLKPNGTIKKNNFTRDEMQGWV